MVCQTEIHSTNFSHMENVVTPSVPPTQTTPPKKSWIPIMIKAERISAWILALAIIGFGITGYGMTKGFIPKDFAQTLHFRFLGAIALVAFVLHTSWGVHLALKRNHLWNQFSKFALISVYVLIVGFFGFMHFFYQPNVSIPQRSSLQEITAAQSDNKVSTSTTTFTSETLKAYNGLNDQPAYVAIDGIVYDLSSVFRNGKHNGNDAGQDLSNIFHGKHPEQYLQGKPIVGTYRGE
jgi:predicted heme/steroid binding protein